MSDDLILATVDPYGADIYPPRSLIVRERPIYQDLLESCCAVCSAVSARYRNDRRVPHPADHAIALC